MKWIDGVVIIAVFTAFFLGGAIWLQYKASLVEGYEYDFRTNKNLSIDGDKNKSFEHMVKSTN